jgi:excinuclease UvrABC nuclease subunit
MSEKNRDLINQLKALNESIDLLTKGTTMLLASERKAFSKASFTDIPKAPGVYTIHNTKLRAIIYIGRTGNLRRRLLGNHKSGNVRGSQFRKALGSCFNLQSEDQITQYILDNCDFQYIVIKGFGEMVRLEHFATAVLAPVLNVKLKQ